MGELGGYVFGCVVEERVEVGVWQGEQSQEGTIPKRLRESWMRIFPSGRERRDEGRHASQVSDVVASVRVGDEVEEEPHDQKSVERISSLEKPTANGIERGNDSRERGSIVDGGEGYGEPGEHGGVRVVDVGGARLVNVADGENGRGGIATEEAEIRRGAGIPQPRGDGQEAERAIGAFSRAQGGQGRGLQAAEESRHETSGIEGQSGNDHVQAARAGQG